MPILTISSSHTPCPLGPTPGGTTSAIPGPETHVPAQKKGTLPTATRQILERQLRHWLMQQPSDPRHARAASPLPPSAQTASQDLDSEMDLGVQLLLLEYYDDIGTSKNVASSTPMAPSQPDRPRHEEDLELGIALSLQHFYDTQPGKTDPFPASPANAAGSTPMAPSQPYRPRPEEDLELGTALSLQHFYDTQPGKTDPLPASPAPEAEAEPEQTPGSDKADWQKLNDNCAEQAIAMFAERCGVEVPRFSYGVDIEDIDAMQLHFTTFVSALNHIAHKEAHQKLEPIKGQNRVGNGEILSGLLAGHLNDTAKVSKKDVFTMRTGETEGGGHFQIVFFDQEQQCWQGYSSDNNKFNITNPGNTSVAEACYERLKGGNHRSVFLNRLHVEDIPLYEEFVVGCRRSNLPWFDVPMPERYMPAADHGGD